MRTISPQNQPVYENFTGAIIEKNNFLNEGGGLLSNRLPQNQNKLLDGTSFIKEEGGISKS